MLGHRKLSTRDMPGERLQLGMPQPSVHVHECSSGQNSNRYPIGVIYRSRWVDRRYLTQSPYVTPNGNATTFVQRSKNLSAHCGVAAIYAQKYQICQLKCCHTRAASSQRFHSVQKSCRSPRCALCSRQQRCGNAVKTLWSNWRFHSRVRQRAVGSPI